MFPLLPQILHYTLQQKIVYLVQTVQYVTSQIVTYRTNVLKRFLCPISYVLPDTIPAFLRTIFTHSVRADFRISLRGFK